MLFNSPGFILVFLPVTFAAYALARFVSRFAAVVTVMLASLAFYSFASPYWTLILIISLLINYCFARVLESHKSRWLLAAVVAFDLGLLGYFKYAGFLAANFDSLTGTSLELAHVALPIGISFYTFLQIAYVVDAWRGRTVRHGIAEYGFFVTFFPHLVAGPILNHRDILPQIADGARWRIRWPDIRLGLAYFAIGLFKKVVLADNISIFATPVFDAAQAGHDIGFLTAWTGVLAYAFQIYFDFSGYSDMAVGLGRMFGVRLPFNFNSPYRATSIIDFWHRWHMTLSRFLRDYLYLPIGGRGDAFSDQVRNIMIVMLLGGLWHGAGWTFVAWGGLHGVYLVLNHAWRHFGAPDVTPWLGRCLTFAAVLVAWVFFRADSLSAARHMLAGMAGLNGLAGPEGDALFLGWPEIRWLAMLWFVCWFLPNTQYLMGESDAHDAAGDSAIRRAAAKISRLSWPSVWAVPVVVLFVAAFANLMRPSPFVYFQF